MVRCVIKATEIFSLKTEVMNLLLLSQKGNVRIFADCLVFKEVVACFYM
jgi:hypothetical protein